MNVSAFVTASLMLGAATTVVVAQSTPVELPQLSVYSPRVALQEPLGTFAMPVSALRFEPLVDVQSRNMAEGQADIAIRGGIFENTGFKVGALSLYDPQTGHYFAEIPVAPAMLTAPEILVGAENAVRGWNANAGTVAYQWKPVRTGGQVTAAVGEFATRRGELYQGWKSGVTFAGRTLAVDGAFAHSRSDGALRFSEHEFTRYNARVQLAGEQGQTDLFYGYQSKFFGWPNLYTPFANVFETENLQTNLVVLNHREELGDGDFVAVGGYYRRNKDHYVFNRGDAGAFNPAFGAAPGPSYHTTWVYSAGAEARITTGEVHWNSVVTFVDDELKSSSLTFGNYRWREHVKLAVVPERSWAMAEGRVLNVKAGAAYDDTDRNGAEVSPVAQITLDRVAPGVGIEAVYVSFAKSSQTPTYTALNSRASAGLFRGNPNLGRETAKNFEVGARGAFGGWSVTTAVFHRSDDQLVDWIYSTSLPNARTASAVDIATTGFEAVARYASKRADLVFGYTGLTKDADYGSMAVNASFYALNFPKHRLTAAAVVRLGAGWEVRMDNEARIQEENALRKSDDEAVISSAGVYFSPAFVKGLRLSVEVENLWDSEFQEVPAVPASPRQVSAGVSYAW
ncbi:TonB-dependent receptor domain-containing protein [Nibricoccus aquaticus]|nr:TonB-dependent receptor [Nibricoccus aquaticus]